jgi:hypothetical protein
MSGTFCLLTASLLAAGAGPGPANVSDSPPAPLVQDAVPPATADTPPPPVRLRDRIRNFFTLHQNNNQTPAPASPAVVDQNQMNWPPRSSSWGQNQQPVPASTVTALRPNLTAQPGRFTDSPDLDKCGHEQDYSWITGRLARDGNRWVIRYAGANVIDRFGGRLPLTGNLDPAKLRDGALVCVLGQVRNSNRGSGAAAPIYLVRQLNFIEPPTRR